MSKQYYVHICLLCLYVASPTLAFHFNVSSDDAPENISSSAPEKVEEDISSSAAEKVELVDCSSLRLGQYICPDPSIDQIDPDTQQFRGCVQGKEIASEGEAEVQCIAASGIICEGTRNSTFKRKMPCKWTNGYSFEIALLLSVFLGMFGLDRFYLGYPGIGLVKLCTLGFMFLGQLLDIILIAAQVVGPSDGSAYVIPYYGAGVTVIRSNNETYLLPQTDWHNIT